MSTDCGPITVPQQAILKDVPMAQSAVARKDVFASR
jgi:hypothetical protein